LRSENPAKPGTKDNAQGGFDAYFWPWRFLRSGRFQQCRRRPRLTIQRIRFACTCSQAGEAVIANALLLPQCNASTSGRAAQSVINRYSRARESPQVTGGIAASIKRMNRIGRCSTSLNLEMRARPPMRRSGNAVPVLQRAQCRQTPEAVEGVRRDADKKGWRH
jgi:hypothetical protein